MKVMEIKADARAIFKKRLNKFLGVVEGNELVHIHDPGRLENVIYEGNEVLLKRAYGKRKTKWDLIAGQYKNKWVFANSSFHSKIALELIKSGKIIKAEKIEKEKKYGESRIDFLLNEKMWLETKGCTLEDKGTALFPDAPTERGRRHLRELINAMENGYEAALLILIFVPSKCFKPNENIDEKFAELFYSAVDKGMDVYPALMEYDGKAIHYKKLLPLC